MSLVTALLAACGSPEVETLGLGEEPPPVVVDESPAPQARGERPEVRVNAQGQYSWALRNTRTGEVRGSANMDSFTSTTESMIKSWIAADFLSGASPSLAQQKLDVVHRMIHVSDDRAAQQLYLNRGGDAVVRRLISTCGLTSTKVHPNWWSKTRMSANDATRMGECLFDGRALNQRWTQLLREEMRSVAPDNNFGIAEAPGLRGKALAVKNGWTRHSATDNWAVNCLAVWEDQVLAVVTSYPARLGQKYGAAICRQVAEQLFPAR